LRQNMSSHVINTIALILSWECAQWRSWSRTAITSNDTYTF
jgi:hypothetical protein